MSLIEQAAKRLEELRRAGAATGDEPAHAEGAPAPAIVPPEHVPTPEAAIRVSARRDWHRSRV